MVDFVTILNPANNQQEASSSGGNSAQAQLQIGPFQQDALLLLTASGTANYAVGVGANAGISLHLVLNGITVSYDDSFEGESFNLSFMSSASYNSLVKRGTSVSVQVMVQHMGAGGVSNTGTRVWLQCYALAVKPNGRELFD